MSEQLPLSQDVLDALDRYATEAFEAGHFPNPVDHSFVGCTTCLIARTARDILDAATREDEQ